MRCSSASRPLVKRPQQSWSTFGEIQYDGWQLVPWQPGDDMNFSGVMIGSEEPHGLAAFYTSVLSEPNFHEDSWYGWDDMAMMIGAHSDVHGRNAMPQRIMLMIEVTDMDEAFATLV